MSERTANGTISVALRWATRLVLAAVALGLVGALAWVIAVTIVYHDLAG
jgi:hypothetical protein